MKTNLSTAEHLRIAREMRHWARYAVKWNGVFINDSRRHQMHLQAEWHQRRAVERAADRRAL